MKKTLLMAAFLFMFLNLLTARAVTIYVDSSNTGGPLWNGTESDPYLTVSNGVDRLKTENGLSQGGHTVIVMPGTSYVGRVDFTVDHSGVAGDPNIIIAPDRAVATSPHYVFYFTDTDQIVLQGFDFTGAHQPNLNDTYGAAVYMLGNYVSNAVRNCNFYGNYKNGLTPRAANSARAKAYVENCNFYANMFSGVITYAWADIYIRNCNFVGNNMAGVNLRHSTSKYYLENNNFYANGVANYGGFGEQNFTRNTVVEINEPVDNSGNIVGNPGWADLANNWNFNSVYEGSPILGAGVGGVDIGSHQNPPLTPVSDLTYYVDDAAGDDTRSSAEAQNPLSPWKTIGKAASEAVAGDTVFVSAGSYLEDVSVNRSGADGKPVIFRASGEALVTGTTFGFGLYRVVDVVIDGFKVTGASQAGVLLSYSVNTTITNLTAFSNAGSGIYITDQSCLAEIIKCNVYSNNSHGIRMNNAGCAIISFTASYENTGAAAGIHLYRSGQTRIVNCEIYGNAKEGLWQQGYLDYRPDTLVRHCSIYGNGTTGLRIDYWSTGSSENTVIAGHPVYGMYWKQLNLSSMTATNCCFYNNGTNLYRDINFDPKVVDSEADLNSQTGWTDVLVRDPGFRNPAGFDLRLRGGSEIIDMGTTTAETDDDFYGRKRLVGPAVDIGAFEMPPPGMFFSGY